VPENDKPTLLLVPPLSRAVGGARPRLAAVDVALAGALLAYAAAYLSWLLGKWGPADMQLAINDSAFVPLGLLTVAAAARAAWLATNPRSRRAWLLLAAGFLAYCAGDSLWFVMEVIQGIEVPFPSLADVGYLAFYPLLLAGLILLPRDRSPSRLKLALDLATVLVGASTIVWWLVLAPVLETATGDAASVLVALAYPVGDILLIFALAVAFIGNLRDTSRAAVLLLGLGVVLNVVADLAYARLSLDATYESGTWIDVLYMFGWFSMGLAGVAESRLRFVPGRRSARTARAPIALPPYLAIAAVDIVLAVSAIGQTPDDAILIAGSIVVTGLVVVRQIVTARENALLLAERATLKSEARFRAIIQNATDVVAVVTGGGRISYVTPSVRTIVDRDPEDLIGRDMLALIHPEDSPLFVEVLQKAGGRKTLVGPVACRGAGPRSSQLELTALNLLDDPVVAGIVVTVSDVTERRAFEDQLRSQALHDPLTGLANRTLFADRLTRAIVRGGRRNVRPALLYMDVDDFKTINDSLGHQAGDRVLLELSRRLRDTVREDDTAARLGGDEFAILLEDTTDAADPIAVAERITAALTQPIELDGAKLHVTVSTGIVIAEGTEPTAVELLRDADIAMYEAKREAHGRWLVFAPEMYQATVERARLEADLRDALDKGQLRLVYQPLIDLENDRIVAVEALLRWDHPERGLLMPAVFIPVAESSGEIVCIGLWVIEEACRTVMTWNAGRPDQPMRANVNVSVRQLEPGFVDQVASILRRLGFPPSLLVLEITESIFAGERSKLAAVLANLRELGVRISIDDFGTGYSALSYLRDLPVDELKIDQAFVSDLARRGDGGLVATILQLGRDLSLETVAEGIERDDQLGHLRDLGCRIGQGYLLGRPAPSEVLEKRVSADSGTESFPRSA
jgi:diguanylate cyclase (GGDEF)-like protein/PAS domain S-box-containing protein